MSNILPEEEGMKDHRGRPMIYKPEYGPMMLEYFEQWPSMREVEEEVASAGRKVKIVKKVTNYPPSIIKFAHSIGVSRNMVRIWAKRHQDFMCIYNRCVEIYEEFLSQRGLTNEYNAGFTRLLLGHHTEVKEVQKVEQEITDKRVININKVD